MISRSPLDSLRYGSLVIFVSLLISGVWHSSEAAAAGRGQQVSATQLIREMDRALGQIERNYRSRDSRNDPFLLSVKEANKALSLLTSDLNLKEKKLGSSVGRMGSAVAGVSATYRYMGIKDPKIHAGMVGLSNSWDAFQDHFMEKAASTRSKLTDEQRQELQELKARSTEMDQKLAELRPRLAGNAGLSNEVRKMTDENRRIAQAQANQVGFMTALTTFNTISGWWHALYWSSAHRRDRLADLLAPIDRWRSGVDLVSARAYDAYFTNIDQTIFIDQWSVDHPFSVSDEAALLGWDEMHANESDLPGEIHDTLEHTDGFRLDDLGGSSPHSGEMHPGWDLDLHDGSGTEDLGGDEDF